jgi:hypothetical protein
MAAIFGRSASSPGAELLREHSPVVIVARIVHADERALLLVDDDARSVTVGKSGFANSPLKRASGHYAAQSS